jgi:hypothetical protein
MRQNVIEGRGKLGTEANGMKKERSEGSGREF